jgi:hypothetical protein
MPFCAYVDDSGGPGHSKHFVLAGLIGHSTDWASFSNEWCRCLAEKPSIRRLKMSAAAGRSGEFYRWPPALRDAKLKALAAIINRYSQVLTYSVIDLAAHAEVWGVHLPKPMCEPYFHPFHNTIMATCFTLWDAGVREPFEIVFDEQVVFGLRARAYYPIIKAIIQHREAEAAQILPSEPVFATDDAMPPLQAADFVAWCIRKCTDDPTYQEMDWLLGELTSLRHTDYSQYYDRERMASVWAQTQEICRNGNIPPDILQLRRELFG